MGQRREASLRDYGWGETLNLGQVCPDTGNIHNSGIIFFDTDNHTTETIYPQLRDSGLFNLAKGKLGNQRFQIYR